jgi:hypothetical protein
MKRVIIFTTNSVEKLHPRIATEQQFLEENGYSVEIVRSLHKREGILWETINLLTLKYFKWGSITKFKKQLKNCDIAHIYDLQLLPLAKSARKQGKYVIFETLDDNVYLHFSSLSTKIPLLRFFKKFITRRVANFERVYGRNYCDCIIVNSKNLLDNFDEGNVTYIPYTSPMEGHTCSSYSPQKETVFLYLGKLTRSKGAAIYKHLIEQYQVKMIFFGKAYDSFSEDFISKNDKIVIKGNLSSKELQHALTEIFLKYNPIGLSIILPENESYKYQEANKDIDYLSMGVPFIGNERPPTQEKIEAGCGVLWQDEEGIRALMENRNSMYEKSSKRCIELAHNYSGLNFESSLLKLYASFEKQVTF